MSNQFTLEARVRYSEADASGKLSLTGLINYLQDCTTTHSEEIGLGIAFLKEKKCAWILSSWNVEILRYPRFHEQIRVSTWASGFKGIFGDRNFTICAADGELLARASSLWVYMDLEKGRPARPGKEEIEKYGHSDPLDMGAAPRKLELPQESLRKPVIPVRRSQIDSNQHMNNCQYIQAALEAFDLENEVFCVKAEYKKSAVYGDLLYPYVSETAEKITVSLCDEEQNLYAAVELYARREN